MENYQNVCMYVFNCQSFSAEKLVLALHEQSGQSEHSEVKGIKKGC